MLPVLYTNVLLWVAGACECERCGKLAGLGAEPEQWPLVDNSVGTARRGMTGGAAHGGPAPPW